MKRCNLCKATLSPEAFHARRVSLDGRAHRCKACVRDYCKRRYLLGRDAILAQHRRYAEAHREAARARTRKHQSEHREEYKERCRRWYQTNRDAAQERMRARHAANPGPARARARAWLDTNRNTEGHRETVRRANATRRARLLAAAFEQVDHRAIYARDGGRCWICWRSLLLKDASFDHVIPLAKGGSHTSENVHTACHPCNKRKQAHLPTPELIGRIRQEVQAIHC